MESLRDCKLPIDRIHSILEGGDANARHVLNIYQDLERDGILSSRFDEYDMSTEETRELTAVRIDRLTQYLETESFEDFFKRLNIVTVYDMSLGIRISINLGLFLNCIKGNGTDEQVQYWSYTREAESIKQVYGCFAMTELGHGSNVAGCETTATFDKETDQFIINTPHIGATKWWIGGAAHSATHSVCYARLLVEGKDYGVKIFVVPLRDSKHDLLPGISIGDIGSKMGRHGVDNGWIQYTNVKIPRHFMLQKWCKVDRQGNVKLPPLEQLSYISLLGGRVYMAIDSYRICARFVTIALRYASVRRQFGNTILDYPLHQKRLLPWLAITYAMAIGTQKLDQQLKGIYQGEDVIKRAKALFIDSASLKSTCTWLAADCIDQCRQACGGHGYSAYNGFGRAYDDWVVQCTWEGDNTVLSLSVAKSMKDRKPIDYKLELFSVDGVLKAVESLLSKIDSPVQISKLKCHYYLLSSFKEKLIPELEPLINVYGYFILETFPFIEYEIVEPKLQRSFNKEYTKELTKVRPLAIDYTDCFKQTDNLLNSAIGQYNLKVYENYFRVVKTQNPPHKTSPDYLPKFLGMLNR
ncbi:acyl-coenzyme A oxidase [[Candida] jaroonii]|uniref:Acyl-coenzyme A oxidase n=1 Tax=[Candida] jaroonii TaxID=467808 RepID=A0ACA9YCZ1_9ASCO|nr:acyl-coenzyme A oxidase [[Candida] jaroonii]